MPISTGPGTDPQAPGPINFYLHEGMFKMFIGVYMIMVFDPQILFNDGFYDLIHVTLPKGSLVHPDFPAALGCRTHALARQFDVLGGALSRHAPEMATAAGYGSSPHFLYSGTDRDGQPFQLMEILYGGIPGRPIGDGMDGHSWWPLFENIPSEYLESYYPMIIEGYASLPDTGGAGRHRGGNGVEKVYRLLEPGEISIHDDRHRSQPWGILGGRPGGVSEKWLIRADGRRTPLESKVDNVQVAPGDRIVFRTAGGGGWGRPAGARPRPGTRGCRPQADDRAGGGNVTTVSCWRAMRSSWTKPPPKSGANRSGDRAGRCPRTISASPSGRGRRCRRPPISFLPVKSRSR